MEIWNRLKVTRGEGGGGQWWEEGEGLRQRTCMNDPQTWTAVWELTVGVRGWEEQRRAKGEKLGQL